MTNITATYPDAYVTFWPRRTTISLTGSQRADFLHNLCTNDIKALGVGDTTEAFITSVQGKTIGHGLIACQSDGLLLTTVPGQADVLIPHLDRYLISEDVELRDVSEELDQLLVWGGRATQLLTEITGAAEADGLRQLYCGESPVTIWPMPYVDGHCMALLGPPETVRSMHALMLNAGGLAREPAALEPLRIGTKFPWFGVDLSDENLPQEVGRDQTAISFQKGCYLGQETVARIDALGHVNKMLRRLSGNGELTAGSELIAEEQVVGRTTSVAEDPQTHGFVGLGYVRRGYCEPGTKLTSGDVDVVVVG